MNEAELLEALCVGEEHPMWKAFLAIMKQFREDCIQTAKNPTLSDKETHVALGGVTVLDDLIDELDARRKQALAKVESQICPPEAGPP